MTLSGVTTQHMQRPVRPVTADDLEHVRKLQLLTLWMAVLGMFFALVAAVASGYLVLTLFRFAHEWQRAFPN